MKQEQFIRIRVKLMEQLRQGAEWSDEEILERIDLLVSETARENRLTVKQREKIRRELFYRCESWISCRNFWTMTG